MLKIYRLHDEGDGFMRIGPELDDDPCERCGGESHPQICLMDGRYHHHGRTHLPGGHLTALCDECYAAIEV